jgi:hypothetical protein
VNSTIETTQAIKQPIAAGGQIDQRENGKKTALPGEC